jgi:hypothetical protein
VLFVAGGVAAILQPWKGKLGPIETANLLQRRLRTTDRYDCREPSGMPVAGEPSWDYVCDNVTHPARQGYLVKTEGSRIIAIRPTG